MSEAHVSIPVRSFRTLKVALVGGAAIVAALAVRRRDDVTWEMQMPPLAVPPEALEVRALFDRVRAKEREARAKPNDPQALFELGMAYGPARRYHEAAAAFERAIRAGKNNAEAHHHLGSCYLYLGRNSQCVAEYSTAIEKDADNVARYITLAEAFEELGQREEAIATIDRAAKRLTTLSLRSCCDSDVKAQPASVIDPAAERAAERAETAGKVASGYASLGRWDKALPLAQRALQIQPIAPWHALVGSCYFNLSRYGEALSHLRLAAKDPGVVADVHYLLALAVLRATGGSSKARAEAYAELNKSVIQDPTMARAWFELGKLCGDREEWDNAAKALSLSAQYGYEPVQSMKLASEMLARGKDEVGALYFRGMYLQNQKQWEAALRCFEKMLTAPSARHRIMAYERIPDLMHQLRRDRDAVRLLEQAVQKERSQPPTMLADLYRQLATAYVEVKDLNGRIRALNRVAELAPESAQEVHGELGALYYSDSRFDEAERLFRKSIKLRPDRIQNRQWLAKTLFARSHEGGRLQQCIDLLEGIVAADPFNAEAHSSLALAYQRADKWQQAIEALKRVIDYEPGRGEAYLELAKSYQHIGEAERARTFFDLYDRYREWQKKLERLETLAKERSDDPDTLYNLAEFFFDAHDFLKAMDRLQQVIKLKPEHARAHRKLAIIYDYLARPADARHEREIAAQLAARAN